MASLKDYEVAKLHAKVKALQYENLMLKNLVQRLLSNEGETQDQGAHHLTKEDLRQVPENVMFTKEDFEEEYEEEEEYYENEEEGYYDEDGNFVYHEEYEYYEEDEEEADFEMDDEPKKAFPGDLVKKLFNEGLLDNSTNQMTSRSKSRKNRSSSSKDAADQEEVSIEFNFQEHQSAMKALYGKGTEQIVSKETKMQSEFNRIRDQLNPILWPCIPLNMKFD